MMLVVGRNKRGAVQIEGGKKKRRRGGARSNRNSNTAKGGGGSKRGSGWWASTALRSGRELRANADRFFFFYFTTHLPHHHHQCPVLPCPLFPLCWKTTVKFHIGEPTRSAWPAKRFKLNVSNGGRAQSKSDSRSFRVFFFSLSHRDWIGCKSRRVSQQKREKKKEKIVLVFLFDLLAAGATVNESNVFS